MTFEQAVKKLIADGMRMATKRMELKFVGEVPCIKLSDEWGYDTDLGLLHLVCKSEVTVMSAFAKAVAKLPIDYTEAKCNKCGVKADKKILDKYKFIKQ